MSDLSDFPFSFDGLQGIRGHGYEISQRIVDPVIILERVGDRTIAKLGGIKSRQGLKTYIAAPSNQHSWVADGKVVRPLPKDAVALFSDTLGPCSPDNITYSQVVGLLRNPDPLIEVHPHESLTKPGRAMADEIGHDLHIEGLNATLFPYQRSGVKWMWHTIRQTGGLILADEMGLGKTLQIIGLLLMEPPGCISPALIVCPASLTANWTREIARFAPGLSWIIHRGQDRTGVYTGLQKSQIVVTTYDTLINDIALFSSLEWSWVICDEAQAIKSPDSNRRQNILRIPRRRTIPMTGTPVENSLLDLWSLADFAIPGILGTREEFERHYPDTMESAREVSRFVDPVIMKRRVSDVAGDLPERIDVDIPIDMDQHLAEHYLAVREQALIEFPIAGALVATLRLQLVCAHPWLGRLKEGDSEGEEADIDSSSAMPFLNPKMEIALSLLSEALANNRKVLVFAIFNRIGDLIRQGLGKMSGIFWDAINGSTPTHERQEIIDLFTAFEGPACLVLNPKAAGAGLNITAATVVIHFTPVWNPALEAQASARAYRRNQKHPVTIYRLFYRETVEQVMLERSIWKSELANETVPVSSRDSTDFRRALEIKPKFI